MAKRSKKQLARQAVAAMCRPEGVSACKWRGLKAYLLAIAEHYPKAYPSQETLAAEMECSVRSIRNYQTLAVKHGLLLVKPDAGRKGINNTWSRTSQYLILTPQILPVPYRQEMPTKPSALRAYGHRDSPCSPNRDESSEPALPVHVSRVPEEPSRQVGKEEPPRLSKSPRPRPTAAELVPGESRYQIKPPSAATVPKWKFITEFFATRWRDMVTDTPVKDPLRNVRAVDSYGHCQRYLNAHFFGAKATMPKTVTEVEDLITEFIDDAYRRRIVIKDGQSAWMAFTGAWGRQRIATNEAQKARDTYVPPTYGST